jgi:hypothetical protein
MTGRVTVGLASIAVVIAVVAIAAHPFLHHGAVPDQHPVVPPRAPTTSVRNVAAAATVAARRAVACASRTRHQASTNPTQGVACGRLTVTRREIKCISSERCQVELIGTLATTDITAVVALTVTLQRQSNAWTAVVVTS